RVARSECADVLPAAREQRVIRNKERAQPARAHTRESGVYFAFGRGVEHLDSKARAASGRLNIADEPRGGRIGRVREDGEVGNPWHHLVHQPQSLAPSSEVK